MDARSGVRRRFGLPRGVWASVIVLGLLGCEQILGIQDLRDTTAEQGSGGGSSSSTGGGSSSGSSGEGGGSSGPGGGFSSGTSSTASSSSGTGGTGGMGGATASGSGGAGGGAGGSGCPTGCVWSSRVGPSNEQAVESIQLDASGNVFVAGTFAGSVDSCDGMTLQGGGATDVFVGKYASGGACDWRRVLGKVGAESVPRIALTPGGGIALGGETNGAVDCGNGELAAAGGQDVFVCTFDKDGNPGWNRMFGDGNYQYFGGVAVDSANNLVVAGGFSGVIDCDGAGGAPGAQNMQSTDIFVCKLSSTGASAWGLPFFAYGPGEQRVKSVAVDSIGDVFIAGEFDGTFSIGVSTLVYNPGQFQPVDVFVAKLNGDGTPSWAKSFGESEDQRVHGIVAAPGGASYVVGHTEGPIALEPSNGYADGFLLKLKSDGTKDWVRILGDGAANQYATSVALDDTGNVIVAGYFGGTIDFGGEVIDASPNLHAYVAAFSPTNQYLWSNHWHIDAISRVATAALDSCTIAVGGQTAKAIDFGCGSQSPKGLDAFIAKIIP